SVDGGIAGHASSIDRRADAWLCSVRGWREASVAALKAVTLDLWGTILYPKDAEEKIERRRAMVLESLLEAGLEIDVPSLRAAYRAAHKIIEEDIGKEFKDLGPPGRWAILTQQLGLPPDAV